MYRKKAHLHFVGIGGIGMSGIAKILSYQGYQISGCDQDLEQKSIYELQSLGCKVYHGNNTSACHDDSIDVLVYSSAIKAHDPEIIRAQQRGIPTIARALMLAELMRTKFSIAIAGSHGKTTTTSLISHILIHAHMDPTVIIGGVLKTISTHAQLGMGDFLVAEADESDRSLIYLQSTLAVVTNINLEHLDTYKDINDLKETFNRFLQHIPFYGAAVLCIDNPTVASLLPLPHIRTIKYGFDTQADLYGGDIVLEPDNASCSVFERGTLLGTLHSPMPGKHNLSNCLAAIAIARELGIPFATIAQAIASFKGVERRFSFNGIYHGAEVFNDYGHHPEEIRNTLLVARQRSRGDLTVIFEPHRYSRLDKLWHDFIEVFRHSQIDTLIVTDVYAASEQPIPGITGAQFAKALQQCHPPFPVFYAPREPDFSSLIAVLSTLLKENDLLLLQGAGKINKLADLLIPTSPQSSTPLTDTLNSGAAL